MDQHPVGADHAVEAIFSTQQAGDDVLVEAKTDFFDRKTERPAVVGHDHGRAGLESGLEGDQVIFEIIPGINLVLAVGKVRILAILLRAAAGEVLGHAGHAVGTERLTLEAADVGGHHARGQLGIFTEGAVDARPARLGGQIGHRVQGGADAHGDIFLAGNIAEFLHQRGIAGGGQPDRFRPVGRVRCRKFRWRDSC